MLSTVIDRLTSLGSKYFVVGAFVPVLVFAFLNGVLLYVEFDWFHDWADPQISGTVRVFDVAALGIALAVLAYVLWSINTFLADVLAGRHLRQGRWLERTLTAEQMRRLRDLRTRYFDARNAALQLAEKESDWTKELLDAAVEGLTIHDTSGTEHDNKANDYDGLAGDTAARLAALRKQREQADDISVAELQNAVDSMSRTLRTNNIKVSHARAGNVLARDRRDLLTLIQYARYRHEASEAALATDLQWRFGPREVVPTTFGNVGAALQSYGLTRYGINLPTFWSRLQLLLTKDTEVVSTVQDAKTQLDFLVSCCWLAGVTTTAWAVVLPIWGTSVGRFLIVMIAGPLVTRLSYLAAVENYIAFGEVVRSSVDLHRLRLLDALHVRQPTSLRDERTLWEALRRVTAFGQDTIDIGYTHPPDAKK
jgi:hypothetical protein